ncbi:MAG: hypothetical protein KJ666_09715 [Bacteroidetes bacterium]|nr:hypothetical protein [Bacteroidota bacterium]MBU2583980.1 hypothetical protein [Bacteroidota bacterium]
MAPLTKGKKLESSAKKRKTANNKIHQSKVKLIKSLAGNVDWSGDLSELRKSRAFNDSL